MDSNVTRRILLETMVALACSPMTTSAAGSAATPRTPVFQSDLPDLSLKNWSVTAVEVAYGPGQSTPAHRHPGLTLVYVLEGEIRSKVGDGPEDVHRRPDVHRDARPAACGVGEWQRHAAGATPRDPVGREGCRAHHAREVRSLW